jgi:hypothetical protein
MEPAALLFAMALPWLLGVALLLALDWPRNEASGVASALRFGFGYMIGAVVLTLWMRALSVAGIAFGRSSIALPLLAVAVALLVYATRKQRPSFAGLAGTARSLTAPDLSRWQRAVWALLLVWLALRFGLLAAETGWRPLYPWDAWVQWATKARVWYELGRIAPFVDAPTWLAGAPGAYFDASPHYPATAPLLQVWTCIVLGRWDDSAMNWPWFAMLVSLTFAVYGALRGEGVAPLIALFGAYFVASLPLLDVHVALAGYADLPMAVVYTLAALATYRWCLGRDARDGTVALFLALACPLIKNPGVIWMLTLVPGVIVALFPRRGLRVLGIGAATILLALLILVRTEPVILNYHLHPNYSPAWMELVRSYFLMGNWNMLWYALVVIAFIGARRLIQVPLVALTAITVTGLAFLMFVFAFTDAAVWLADLTTANRATLHIAPLLIVLGVLTWHQLAMRAPANVYGVPEPRTA